MITVTSLLKLGITTIFLVYTTLILQQHRSSERAAGAHHRRMTRDIAEWNRIVRKGRERVQWQAQPVDWMTGEMGR